MPVPSNLSLNEIISFKAIENEEKGFPLTCIYCGELEQFQDQLDDLEENFRNVRIINSQIWYRANESEPHKSASTMFGLIFSDVIARQRYSHKYSNLVHSPTIFNKFSCGTVQTKIPDAALSLSHTYNESICPV